MNPENPIPYKGIEKEHEEALKIDEGVDAYYERARTNKERPADQVAHDLIREEIGEAVPLSRIPEDLRPWYRNLRGAGVNFLEDGFVEISRWDNTGKYFKKPKLMKQKVEGINSAIRMQDHVLGGYHTAMNRSDDGEISRIESIQEIIEQANVLLNNWKNVELGERKDLQWQLTEVVLQLEKCRNEFKVRVKDQATAVVSLRDSRGRENPSALAARTVAALNSLSQRINEMHLIAPQIALRKEVLVLEKRRSEKALSRAEAVLTGVLHNVVFNERPGFVLAEKIKDHEVSALNNKFTQVQALLEMVLVAPYFQQAKQAKHFLSLVQEQSGSRESFVENLGSIRDGVNDVKRILTSDVEHFG